MSELLGSAISESLTPEVRDAVLFGRLKRIEAIERKLRRGDMDMKLNEMNDIAGCRVVAETLTEVEAIVESIKGRLPIFREKDYVKRPKKDGYRSVHLITRHNAQAAGYEGLYCETQVRTKLQHAWATALETFDIVNKSEMKSGGGSSDERRFFMLASALLSMEEGAPCVPGVPETVEEIRTELINLDGRIRALDRLRACSGSVTILQREEFSGSAYCLLDIDYELQLTHLYVFTTDEAIEAARMYAELESANREGMRDALLVKVASLRDLRDAYPNYSMDIRLFLGVIGSLTQAGR
ncbi:RelA/SpoT domain-containing protein [Olsenella sp. An293]|uniref:RelA/SpoT domain-containing protein n=1 Tax=Olsenella sp. An293 TaxID=1965626 RepID=UPI0013024328|nr:RelA/SpoT domain-containing protein [Olsenella sp. An293]